MTQPTTPPRTAASRPLAAGLATALALLLSAPASAQDEPAPDVRTSTEAEPLTAGEQQLAKLLEGRRAGEPVSCIRAVPNQLIQTIEQTAYVFGRGNTIYVQRTRDPAQISRRDTLVTQRFVATQMCKLDVMTTVDPVTGIFTGVVMFEDFVPYTRIKDGDAAR